MDIEISAVQGVDGTLIPVIAQIFSSGKSDSDKNLAKVIAFGPIIGFAASKNTQGFLLAHETFTVQTREDVWINPKLAVENQPDLPQFVSEKIYPANFSKKFIYKPYKIKKSQPLSLDLSNEFQWDQIELVAINGKILPEKVSPIQHIKSKKNQSFIFNSWDLIEFFPFATDEDGIFHLQFAAKSSGRDFRVESTIETTLQSK